VAIRSVHVTDVVTSPSMLNLSFSRD